MIGRIQGQLVEITDNVALVDVAGVAYEVELTSTAMERLPQTGADVVFHTHFIVREDAQLLYGFASRDERDLFRALIKINSVGPKVALNVISTVSLGVLADAVANRDASPLTRVPGVGKKTAERLVMELKDQLGVMAVPQPSIETSTATAAAAAVEAERALAALHYKPQEAARAVASVLATLTEEEASTEQLVRSALKQLLRQAEVVS